MTANPSASGGVAMEDAEEAVFAKCTWRVLPIVTLVMFLGYLDRSSVAFAALTMNRDLGLSPSVYGFGAGAVFLGIALCAVPSALIVNRVGARRSLFFMVLGWSLLSAGCAFVMNASGLIALRFLLGCVEAGAFPGIVFYLSLWIPKEYRAGAIALLMSSGPISNIVAGPVAALCLGVGGFLGIRGWQWVFLLEAMPAFLLAFAVLVFVSDRPADAAWLSADEKALIARRLAAQNAPQKGAAAQTFRDPQLLLLALGYLGIEFSVYGFNFWVPQILQQLGFAPARIGLIIAGLFAAAMVAQNWSARASDAAGEHMWFAVVPALIAVCAWVVTAEFGAAVIPALLGLLVVRCAMNATYGPFWALACGVHRGSAAAAGLGFMSAATAIGGFAGPATMGVLRELTGNYTAGILALAAAMLVFAASVLVAARRPPKVSAQMPACIAAR